ncbi:hypothetical protein CRUP_025386, partial [Coryphaenoides rupestris]
VHVLTYTVYQLLAALGPTMKAGQIDHCISLLLEVREGHSRSKLRRRATAKKSMASYELILEASSSVKVCGKVGDVLRRMVLGLLANQGVDHQDLLLLSHALVSQSLPLLTQRDRHTNMYILVDTGLKTSAQLNQPTLPAPQGVTLRPGPGEGRTCKLVQSCFKVLLGYAEEDIYDQSRQATAFNLLKVLRPPHNAILPSSPGKLIVPEMEQLLSKIYQEVPAGLPAGQKLRGHLEFVTLLTQHSGLFLAPLALVMLNDDSALCKKMAAVNVKALLGRLDLTQQNAHYALVQTWMASEKANLRRLGAQVCGLFVEVEGDKFARRLDDLLPIVEKELRPDNYEDMEDEETEKGHIEAHLRYPHCWVWVTASQLFGQLFAAHQPQELIQMWRAEGESGRGQLPLASAFLASRLDSKVIKNLIFVAKTTYLISPESEVTSTQEVVEGEEEKEEEEEEKEEEEVEGEGEKEEEEEEEEEDEGREAQQAAEEEAEVEREEEQVEEGARDDRPPSLLWIIQKLSVMARREAANTPRVPLKRLCVFKFLGAISMDLGPGRLAPYLTPNLSQELIELLKKQVGLKTFSMAFSGVQKEFSQRRAARRLHRARQAVANPDIAARKKMKKHKNKIQARKRKIERLRPDYKAKRPRSQTVKNLAVLR